ncbi:SRPBCC domain-containing protein [Pseudidiomarina homiensis]|uniref:Polyketide cyclase/dehydrase n=1 Tax=Pseudidiomarina homiensis TaxID=364198 RepID=A0A432Y425_9GAMM|nr:SRPBCC domain-containing protein [Pseudidiomarina homiensis]RUO55719.1 polyketide cyclase/dehydrase [Pseudidiomarina homiensis]
MNAKLTKCAAALAFVGTLFLPVSKAEAEILDSSTDGFTFEFSLPVDGHLKLVFDGLTQDIGQWWLADHTWYGRSENMSIRLIPGGCLCEIADEMRFTEHLRVVKVEPHSLVRFSGGLGPLQAEGVDGVMDWSLANNPDEHMTTLTVRYRVGGYTGNDLSRWAPAVENVLQQQMKSFQSYMKR